MMTPSNNQPQFPSEAETRPDPLDLERIYEEYVDQIYRFLYTRVGNREDAEDLTSQVFLKGFRRLDVERDGRSIASWLFTVARTVLADHWRQAYRYGPPAELHENLPGRSEVPDPWDDTAKVQRVDEVLARLPARSRTVLELRFLRGYSLEETARALGISIGNVKVIQHRALARAAELMDEGSASGASSASADRAIA